VNAVVEFLRMGGYAAYVWPAYGITAVVMLGLLVATLRDLRANERTLQTLRQARRAAPARNDEDPAHGEDSVPVEAS